MRCGGSWKSPSPVVNVSRLGEPMNTTHDDDREPFHLNRPPYDSIRKSLRDAVSETLEKDWDLVALGCHEQSIAHRIAVYLEPSFPNYHTDCEYNKRKHFKKDYPAESGKVRKGMRPDIIVHRRDNVENVLAVEMKANGNESTSNDPQKLQALYSDAAYLYKAVAFVQIQNDVSDIEDGCLRAVIKWFDVGPDGLTEREPEQTVVEYSGKVAEVVEIYKRRLKSTRSSRSRSRKKRPQRKG